ncbi:RES family NAD+ phosphorylase [Fundidesulfovibrio soli]|uniref:RES family NAD+ phosphorylase n=1 Tax=Fundidesulfovibrio soli TaxID=2922716 RepID=UPI001FAED280|nr:RES family NAD+ phosphorylase [Fundidesulfovibrio soli]
MTTKFCCPECFGDRGLRKDIIPSLDHGHGTCNYCGSTDVDLVVPSALSLYFELVINAYEIGSGDITIVEWLKNDWKLFGHPRMDVAHAKELLGEILNNGDIVRRSFVKPVNVSGGGLVQWEALRDELMYKNRWFLEERIDSDRMKQLLAMLIADPLSGDWFRARIRTEDGIFSVGEMGAPPKQLATHGRANPAGIPYLYLASKPETATAEIRPHTGERACVARFSIPEIRAVDLRNPREFVSPFILAETEDVKQLLADLPFLERLGEELTRPVLPHGAAINYIPSQYLCEFIKKCGFNGVVYRSSVSDGINLALFDPGVATPHDVQLYNVARVTVEVEPQ